MPQTADGYYLTSYSLFTLLQGYIYRVNATAADEIPSELTEAKVTAPHPTSISWLTTPFPLSGGHVPGGPRWQQRTEVAAAGFRKEQDDAENQFLFTRAT